MGHLVCPTVLLVDDQPTFGRALKSALLDKGSVGSLFVPTLKEAAAVLQSKTIHFDAVITDWLFETGDDPEHDLFDGLDLVDFVRKISPSIQTYLITAQSETDNFRTKLIEAKYSNDNVFIKQEINIDGNKELSGKSRQPWNRVRRDVIKSRIRAQGNTDAEALLSRLAGLSDDDELARAMEAMLPPMVTYVEDIGVNYRIKKAIEVTCTPERDEAGETTVRASASKLGLLVDAFGETPSEAVSNLKFVILDTADEVLALPESEVSSFAKIVIARFQEHMEPTNAASQL
jgi:CheY-like chemotaxis protein